MKHIIAQYGTSKVEHNDVSGLFCLIGGDHRSYQYADNPVDVLLFEMNPTIQSKLMEQVLNWKSGYRILSMSR